MGMRLSAPFFYTVEKDWKGKEEGGGKEGWTYGDFATIEIGYRSVKIADTHEEKALAYC